MFVIKKNNSMYVGCIKNSQYVTGQITEYHTNDIQDALFFGKLEWAEETIKNLKRNPGISLFNYEIEEYNPPQNINNSVGGWVIWSEQWENYITYLAGSDNNQLTCGATKDITKATVFQSLTHAKSTADQLAANINNGGGEYIVKPYNITRTDMLKANKILIIKNFRAFGTIIEEAVRTELNKLLNPDVANMVLDRSIRQHNGLKAVKDYVESVFPDLAPKPVNTIKPATFQDLPIGAKFTAVNGGICSMAKSHYQFEKISPTEFKCRSNVFCVKMPVENINAEVKLV